MQALHEVFVTLSLVMLVFGFISYAKPNWSYELNNVEAENLTPDIVTVNLHKIRIARGLYAINGEIDIKQDLTDDLHIEIDIFTSPTGSNRSYVRTPFRVDECTLSEYGQKYYKVIFMEGLATCSDNSWQFGDKVAMPLTKRLIKINNCEVPNDNMASHLRPGYYRVVFRYTKQAQGSLTLDVYVSMD